MKLKSPSFSNESTNLNPNAPLCLYTIDVARIKDIFLISLPFIIIDSYISFPAENSCPPYSSGLFPIFIKVLDCVSLNVL